MKLFSICMLLLLSVLNGDAQPETAAGKLLLTNRSSFSPDRISRNPFWPIGWTPSSVPRTQDATPDQPQVVTIPPESLVVSTTLVGSPSIAIVNGREITVGSTLIVTIGGGEARLKVLRIGDGFVDFDYQGKIIRASGN